MSTKLKSSAYLKIVLLFQQLERKKHDEFMPFSCMRKFYDLDEVVEEAWDLVSDLGDNKSAFPVVDIKLVLPNGREASLYNIWWEGGSVCTFVQRSQLEKYKETLEPLLAE
jgi:hypothetical protein